MVWSVVGTINHLQLTNDFDFHHVNVLIIIDINRTLESSMYN